MTWNKENMAQDDIKQADSKWEHVEKMSKEKHQN